MFEIQIVALLPFLLFILYLLHYPQHYGSLRFLKQHCNLQILCPRLRFLSNSPSDLIQRVLYIKYFWLFPAYLILDYQIQKHNMH